MQLEKPNSKILPKSNYQSERDGQSSHRLFYPQINTKSRKMKSRQEKSERSGKSHGERLHSIEKVWSQRRLTKIETREKNLKIK